MRQGDRIADRENLQLNQERNNETLFKISCDSDRNYSLSGSPKPRSESDFRRRQKVVKDPVTGTMLTFLTSTPDGDSKIYQTHNQWTSDGQWLIFRSNRVRGEAMAVNEKTGEMVQVTEGGYTGMLSIARNSMKLYFMRNPNRPPRQRPPAPGATPGNAPQQPVSLQIIEVDLEKLFADSKAGNLKSADFYQKGLGTTPVEIQAGGDMALDGG